MEEACAAKYPVLLVHGVGYRDAGIRIIGYWGRIPDALKRIGCRVYFGGQDAWGTIDANAKALAARVRGVLAESGAEKVNIIAHSKGGLDARKMLTLDGMSECVASLTTVATPHHGLEWVDDLLRLPRFLFRIAAKYLDWLYIKIMGDENPCSLEVAEQFTTAYMERFNAEVADVPGVYYQSYTAAMSHNFSDFFLWIIHAYIRHHGGENDGLVTVKSAQWTNFREVWRTESRRGISHLDEIDFRRVNMRQRRRGRVNIAERYVDIVSGLAKMGL